MKVFLQFFKDYWSFILIAIYSIGYCYNYIYYISFGINIFNYITISDLLFFSIEQIMLIIVLVLLYEIIGIYLCTVFFKLFTYNKAVSNLKTKYKKKKLSLTKEYLDKVIVRYENSKMPRLLLTFSFFWSFSVILFKYLNIPILTIGVLESAGFIYVVFRLFMLPGYKGGDTNILRMIALLTVYFFIIIMTCFQAFFSSDDVKNERNITKHLNFNYLGKSYNLDDKLRFVGETSTYIFLYNKTDESTLIFPKTKVDNLKINANDSFLFNRGKNDK